MQTYTVEKTEKSIIVGLKDVNQTFVSPLIRMLNEDKDVEYARFVDSHPELCDMKIYVQVKKGSPEDAVKRAFGKIADYYSKIKV